MSVATRKRLVELYFDVLSPYSYVSFVLFNRCSRRWKALHLDPRPVLMGGIYKPGMASGVAPLGMLKNKDPSKATYLRLDVERISKFYDVPLRHPKDVNTVLFEKGSLGAQKLLTAARQHDSEHFVALANEIYARIWYKDLDVTENASLAQACSDAGISDQRTQVLLQKINDSRIEDALEKTTKEAVEDGVFGVPSYVLHMDDGRKEMFFGTDRMFLLADHFGEHWPVAKV